MNLGSFKKYKHSSKKDKLDYFNLKLNFLNKELFYRSSKEYVEIFQDHFSNVIDISHFSTYCQRPYKTPLNLIKSIINKFLNPSLNRFITKRLFGSYYILEK